MAAKGTTPEGFTPPAPAPGSSQPHTAGASASQVPGSPGPQVPGVSAPHPREDIEARVATLSYEDARARLVDIVSRLEQGSIPLEESLRLWEVGESLARHCQSWLDGAAARIDAAERGESLVAAPMAAPQPAAATTAPAPATAPANQGAPANQPAPAAAHTGGYQAPAPAISPQASKEDRVAALREAVREVRAEDVPAIQPAPEAMAEATPAPAAPRGASVPAGGPAGTPAGGPATAPPSAEEPAAGEDDDDFDPEEFADGTGLDTTPLTRHPEDFA
ncbi:MULTISPECIES: exodeoxyribonuclease VII small subunit [Actinotignum]|uniref:Exodeoxyribonuclease 7 small subunit n=3 Tax=Actinotignum timonense TaxID=1870995 RepID=A0AAW9HBY6_9ACTO|nr:MULTISPECIES: exodeoxyribonuclease VII small subunit [Actinotignum]MDE1559086.1 exodeoxyribonuclease VII small subunit [Actinotignum schaalii]MDE1664055.1 exodeoxyribonuclease VII small subunit [Actinotignum schaalii]MDK6373825.1 exodeoxyribonuclease VII small subunit [Actinotignum timonense]MDK6419283.1 exodeoxyribonuclease VII small subunit [Actinotignum timonense]MDK6589810.1 exodeoxyribonuclease VII small subunit [Actinotignum timonense]